MSCVFLLTWQLRIVANKFEQSFYSAYSYSGRVDRTGAKFQEDPALPEPNTIELIKH